MYHKQNCVKYLKHEVVNDLGNVIEENKNQNNHICLMRLIKIITAWSIVLCTVLLAYYMFSTWRFQ